MQFSELVKQAWKELPIKMKIFAVLGICSKLIMLISLFAFFYLFFDRFFTQEENIFLFIGLLSYSLNKQFLSEWKHQMSELEVNNVRNN